MGARMTLPLLFALAVPLGAAAQESAPAATSPSVLEVLAGRSLIHQARSLGHLAGGARVAKIGRIGVLLKRARRYIPNDPELNRQLVNLNESFGELALAAEAAGRYVEARPQDYAAGIRWMRLSQSKLQNAADRNAFLKKVEDDKRFGAGVRATAVAWMASTHLRQGDRKRARSACRRALALDAYEPVALDVLAKLSSKPKPIDNLRHTIVLFAGNPRRMENAWLVAELLQAAGNYKQAIAFYEHAYAVSQAKRPGASVLGNMLVGYFNALLDAGRAEDALKLFGSLIAGPRPSLALQALMVEAYRKAGRNEQAAKQVEAMAKVYEPLAAPGAKRTGLMAADLAWFHLRFRGDTNAAIRWAEEAARSAGHAPQVVRVLGACELAIGRIKTGVKRLEGVAAKEPYAAALLAELYYDTDQADAAREVLLRGVGDVRTLAPWRALAAIAAKHGVQLPARADAEAMLQAMGDLPAHAAEVGRFPERFVEAKLTAPREQVRLAEPIEVILELRNVSKLPIPLGQEGLFSPVVLLDLTVEGDLEASFPSLISEQLPAPKYLAPGQKVSRTVRVDVGSAERLLMTNPLATLKLTIAATLDPLQDGRRLVSSVPGVNVLSVTIQRKALFAAQADKETVERSLGGIVRELQQGTPALQARAAWRTAALVALARRVELGEVKTPLPAGLNKPILLSMARAHIRSRSSLARAEMLAALHHVTLDEHIIALLAPCIEDRSGLVRMRLIELLAAKKTRGRETLLDLFANDPDREVGEMASVFRGGK